MRMQLTKEAFVATLVMLIAVYLISFVPLKFELAKPIKQEFGDFDMYDLVFSGKHKEITPRDTNIVLIQVGDSRAEIAGQLKTLRQLQPKLIALDVLFEKTRDAEEDSALVREIRNTRNLVIASNLVWDSSARDLVKKSSFFADDSTEDEEGYINFIGEEFSVVRNFSPFVNVNKGKRSSFAAKIIEKISPESWNLLKQRDRSIEVINYNHNQNSYLSLSKDDLFQYAMSRQLNDKLKDKIVLVGFFTRNTPLVLEDLHFTPMNEKISGKSNPDMYGLLIHANIVGMILSGKYTFLLSGFWTYCLAGILCFFLLLFVLGVHVKNPHPGHLRFVLIQFSAIILLSYLFLILFEHYRIKIPLLPIILALIMSVELLGVYKVIARVMHGLFGYKTIFVKTHL